MDWTQWRDFEQVVRSLDQGDYSGRTTYTDADIVLTFFWAVFHKRATSWACRSGAWPIFVRHIARPSPSRMSRRLRTPGVQTLIAALQRDLRPRSDSQLALAVDGKIMRVAAHSRDRAATFGLWGMRGYKLHAVCDLWGRIVAHRVTPLHCHEAVIARRLVRDLPQHGYMLADANYHDSKLFAACSIEGVQLVAPRRTSSRKKGTRRNVRIQPSRRRCIDLLERDNPFGTHLVRQRRTIERVFGRLETNHGLGHPPAHVRGLRRVRLWVAAVLILDQWTAMRRAA